MPYFFYLIYRMPDGILRSLHGRTSDLDRVIFEMEEHGCKIVDIDYES